MRLAVDRFLRGVRTVHAPVRCVCVVCGVPAGTAVAFHSRLLSVM